MNFAFKAAMAFDKELALGITAEVRWTNNGHYHRAVGTIVKVNKMSARVAIASAIYAPKYEKAAPEGQRWTQGDMLYEAGREINAPRCVIGAMERWSVHNGIFPVEKQ